MTPQNHEERVTEKLLRGSCCSQTVMSLALEDLGLENEGLLAAMKGFCGGMGNGGVCGSLAAAVAALYVCDASEAARAWQHEFIEWFHGRFGACDCRDIVGDDIALRSRLCPQLTLETYLELRKYIA